MGLATSFSIIKKHDGHIFAESKESEGSCFNILIPASQNELTDITHLSEEPIPGEGTILIMDDEKLVREVMGNMLICLGYTVKYAKNGKEAIDKYKQAKQTKISFDCVILDLTVCEGMGGKETMRELLKFDPDITAIVTSGYSNDPIIANFKNFGFKDAIIKPIKISELSNIMHNTIQTKNNQPHNF